MNHQIIKKSPSHRRISAQRSKIVSGFALFILLSGFACKVERFSYFHLPWFSEIDEDVLVDHPNPRHYRPGVGLRAKEQMVVSSHAYASHAAAKVLAKSDSAIAAGMAAFYMLGLVKPYAGGLGGDALILYHDAKSGKTFEYNGRGHHAKSMPDDFHRASKVKLKNNFPDRTSGGAVVTVPGALRAFYQLARDKGQGIDFKDVVAPAVQLGRHGFHVDQEFGLHLHATEKRLRNFDSSIDLFFIRQMPFIPGQVMANETLAQTMEDIGALGAKGDSIFYQGEFTKKMLAAISDKPFSGFLTAEDFKLFKVKARLAKQQKINGKNIIFPGLPHAAGSVVQLLKMWDKKNIKPFADALVRADEANSKQSEVIFNNLIEAQLLASLVVADFEGHVADYESLPGSGDTTKNSKKLKMNHLIMKELTGDELLKQRLNIEPKGKQPWEAGLLRNHSDDRILYLDRTMEMDSVSSIIVRDSKGNWLVAQLSLGRSFGSALTVSDLGFVLNNHVSNFHPLPGFANSIKTGSNKSPRSTFMPMLVAEEGQVNLAITCNGSKESISICASMLHHLPKNEMISDTLINAPRVSGVNQLYFAVEPEYFHHSQFRAMQKKRKLSMKAGRSPYDQTLSDVSIVRQTKDGYIYGFADVRGTARPVSVKECMTQKACRDSKSR